jgi:hypothetical protein
MDKNHAYLPLYSNERTHCRRAYTALNGSLIESLKATN